MTDAGYERAYELLRALIYPARAETPEQEDALDLAAQAQAEYEELLPGGGESLSESNDGVSVSVRRARVSGGVCPAAKAYLKNAGLLRNGLPLAKPV